MEHSLDGSDDADAGDSSLTIRGYVLHKSKEIEGNNQDFILNLQASQLSSHHLLLKLITIRRRS